MAPIVRLSPHNKGLTAHMDAHTLQKLGRQKVSDETGNQIKLSALWKDKRVVLVFIRHFG
jgi:hypothetical protein